MGKDVKRVCSRVRYVRKKSSYKLKESLIPLKNPINRPRVMVAYDFAIWPWSSQGFVVLVAVDLFSNHLGAWPLKNKENTSVIERLEHCWFNSHGI